MVQPASTQYFIGLMSGTSMDGIDAALVSFENSPNKKHPEKIKLIATHTENMPAELHQQLMQFINNESTNQQWSDILTTLGETNITLGKTFAQAALNLLKQNNISSEQVTAIGCHGQTIFHHPDSSSPFSWQLGDANTIAYQTGITTISDFRNKDIAAGGQGAPLAPAFHETFFQHSEKNSIILNLGGIANVSVLHANNNKPTQGFDTGPANTLMDAWCLKHRKMTFDKDGAWAQQGSSNENLLNALLADDYFQQAPPKSTGREYFNMAWLENILSGLKAITAEDTQATLAAFSAHSIANAINSYCDIDEFNLLLCGGGAHNQHFVGLLQNLLPKTKIQTTEVAGINPDWVEAAAFAWLAKQRLEEKPGNSTAVTGAVKKVILGSTHLAG